jgi:hypothetical protein
MDAVGATSTVTFALSGTQLMATNAGSAASTLTRTNVSVTNLIFTHIVGTNSHAVRIEMTLEKNVRGRIISKDFRTFVILDAS